MRQVRGSNSAPLAGRGRSGRPGGDRSARGAMFQSWTALGLMRAGCWIRWTSPDRRRPGRRCCPCGRRRTGPSPGCRTGGGRAGRGGPSRAREAGGVRAVAAASGGLLAGAAGPGGVEGDSVLVAFRGGVHDRFGARLGWIAQQLAGVPAVRTIRPSPDATPAARSARHGMAVRRAAGTRRRQAARRAGAQASRPVRGRRSAARSATASAVTLAIVKPRCPCP
jgi:hypothetical protein